MALKRVKYGVEFSPTRHENEGSSGIGWIVALVLIVALVSFVFHLGRRLSARLPADEPPVAAGPVAAAPAADTAGEAGRTGDGAATGAIVDTDLASRPRKARNLLLRLQNATQQGDLPLQVTTLELLLELGDDSVADLDARFVQSLGELNRRWLIAEKNPQWVADVTVKRGDSATCIARENGCTLASLRLLNPSVNIERLTVGSTLKVMRHPSFTLIVHKRLRAVDLNLNGKLFKRYLLPDDAKDIPLEPGGYRTGANLRAYFRQQGIGLSPADAAEIDELVPRDTPVRVSAS